MTSNHGGGRTGGEIIEKESWRGRHLGGMWEASERHLGSIWEASGKHLGSIWEASERHLRGIWEASGGAFGSHLGGQASQGPQEAPGGSESQKSMPISAKIQKFHLVFNFTRRF